MYLVDNILIDPEIAETRFACDLPDCKGGCCTFPGDWGAPIKDSEVEILKQCVPAVTKYLSEKSVETIEKCGVVQGVQGDYSTTCIEHKDCVFVYYEGDIAKCSIEKAFLNGETIFRKPISCHLFPIRVEDKAMPYLYFSYFEECKPALVKGKEENIFLLTSVQEALCRSYGELWYDTLSIYLKANGFGG